MTAGEFKPITEQENARSLFLKREGLRIDAYAGAGKTTTLRLLAGSTSERGLYLAFNRSIADEARSRFPSQVTCSTGHSMAFRGVRRSLGYPEWKLTGALTPSLILAAFPMPESISFHAGLTLQSRVYCGVLLDALRKFLESDDEEPQEKHMPRHGSLAAITDEQFQIFSHQAISHVQAIWNAMRQKGGAIPLGHDGYLKLWALSQPRAQMDYLMVDEAQDINPVLFGVLRRLDCPIVYVGDPYQQIYEWRGAINAMDQIASKHRILLTQSFRFGDAIASAATAVIRRIGAKEPVRGLSSLVSHLSRVRPDAILCRSNAGVIGSVLLCLARGAACHVLGGTRELERVLGDVQRVKHGGTAQSAELLGFAAWKDVMEFSAKPEGQHLRSLVTLVQEYGEGTMLRALARCERDESTAAVVCATAHRAKGREWTNVRVDPDFESGFNRATQALAETGRNACKASFEAEVRLLYVALTRAKTAVDLPRSLMHRFDLAPTTEKIIDRAISSTLQPAVEVASITREEQAEVVSPYHSPRNDESSEMAALRRHLR